MKSSSKAPPSAAHADYISRDGKYARRGGVELVESGNMPEFAQADSRAFWVAADMHERANGRAYTELQIALPREFARAQREELARELARELLGDRFAYTLAIHSPLAKDNIEQPHLHLMFSERAIDSTTRTLPEDKFFKRNGAKKDPVWNDRNKPEEVRAKWCEMMNRAMEREGIDLTVDPRSWADQGRDDLAALVEQKTLGGNSKEAIERRAKMEQQRQQRQMLPAMHFDGPVAAQVLELEAEKQIAEIQKRLEREVGIIEKLIAAAKALAQAGKVMAVRVQNFVSGTNALEKENALLIPSLAIDRQLRELADKIQSATGLDSISLTEQEAKLLMDALYETPYRLWGTRQAPGSNAVRSLMQGPWERGEIRHIKLKEEKGEVSLAAPEPPRSCEFFLWVPSASRLEFAQELRMRAGQRLSVESRRLLQSEKPRGREKLKLDQERD